MSNNYSWEERYNHVREAKTALWNAAQNFIAETYCLEALDRYLETYHSGSMGFRFPITKKDVEREGVKALLKLLIARAELTNRTPAQGTKHSLNTQSFFPT